LGREAPASRRSRHSTAAAASAAENPEAYLQSVVKVFTVSSSPNYFMPWQNKPQSEKTGSGVVALLPLPDVPNGIGVLTNAHVVSDQTFVQVRRHGSSVKYQARVYAVGHDCDLAVLTVQDPKFFADSSATSFTVADASGRNDDGDGPTTAAAATGVANMVRPPPLGDVPYLQEQVSVMGFPSGGDNLSITSGVVSRIELTNYVHGAAQLLAIQLDAAINPGNSGGPALQGGKVVGLAFQNLPGMDNIGYVIPTPIIRRFLEDIATDAGKAKARAKAMAETTADGKTDAGAGTGAGVAAALVASAAGARAETGTDSIIEKTGSGGGGGGGGGGSGGGDGDAAQSHTYDHAGFCMLGIKCQPTDNPAMRSYLGMLPHETGVLVTYVVKVRLQGSRLWGSRFEDLRA